MKTTLISVLAVDDELPIRQELEMFPWEAYGYRLIAVAKNAKEALWICGENTPDIVITDVTMPVMNGLELIRELSSRYPKVKTLILTCHEDFGYVREAMNLGALDYILKLDMSEKPMIKSLDKVRKIIKEEQNQKLKEMDSIREKIAGKIAQRKGNKEVSLDEIGSMIDYLGFPIHYFQNNYFLMVENQMKSWAFVQAIFREIFHSREEIKNWFVFDDNCYAIFLKEENREGSEKFIRILYSIVHKKMESMEQYLDFYMVRAKAPRVLREYCGVAERIKEWRNYHFYHPDLLYIEEEWIFEYRDKTEEDLKLLCNLQVKSGEEQNLLVGSFDMIIPTGLKEMIIQMAQQKNVNMGTYYKEVWAAENVVKLEQIYRQIFQIEANTDLRYEIRQALKIIREKYGQNLTLTWIAECVHLSPPYLSKLFRETMGKSFNDYVVEVRMENAKRLIKESGYKVYQIAEMVGIPNYRYFSTAFKKHFGISPKEMAAGKDKK